MARSGRSASTRCWRLLLLLLLLLRSLLLLLLLLLRRLRLLSPLLLVLLPGETKIAGTTIGTAALASAAASTST